MIGYSKQQQLHSKRRTVKVVTCKECGVEFERRIDQINRRSNNNYCSPKCANTANGRKNKGKILARRGAEITCVVCEKKFYVPPSRVSKKPKFCSKKCNGLFQQSQPLPKGFITGANNKGEKNGRYKDGKRIGTNTTKKKVREAVRSRDGDYCLKCGKPGSGLHLHRVVYGSQGGKYEVNNCVLLCSVHHEEVHSNKRKWMPILLEHLQRKAS